MTYELLKHLKNTNLYVVEVYDSAYNLLHARFLPARAWSARLQQAQPLALNPSRYECYYRCLSA